MMCCEAVYSILYVFCFGGSPVNLPKSDHDVVRCSVLMYLRKLFLQIQGYHRDLVLEETVC